VRPVGLEPTIGRRWSSVPRGANKNPGGERRPGFCIEPEGDRRTPSSHWEGRQVIGNPSLCRARICPSHTPSAGALRRTDLCLVWSWWASRHLGFRVAGSIGRRIAVSSKISRKL